MKQRALEIHVEGIELATMPAGGERRLREALQRALSADGGDGGGGGDHARGSPKAIERRMRAGVMRAIGKRGSHVQ
jgi:hypothetical protein